MSILPESTLRYYEKKDLIKIARNSSGRREYEESDIEWIKFIRWLKEMGMLLRNIQKYSELRYCGKSTMPERLGILEVHRKYVLEQQLISLTFTIDDSNIDNSKRGVQLCHQ